MAFLYFYNVLIVCVHWYSCALMLGCTGRSSLFVTSNFVMAYLDDLDDVGEDAVARDVVDQGHLSVHQVAAQHQRLQPVRAL